MKLLCKQSPVWIAYIICSVYAVIMSSSPNRPIHFILLCLWNINTTVYHLFQLHENCTIITNIKNIQNNWLFCVSFWWVPTKFATGSLKVSKILTECKIFEILWRSEDRHIGKFCDIGRQRWELLDYLVLIKKWSSLLECRYNVKDVPIASSAAFRR